MKFILVLLFGRPVQGEKYSIPGLPPSRPLDQDGYNQWSSEFRVGSRYGTKGSFYFSR